MTISPEAPIAPAGFSPVDAALEVAREEVEGYFDRDIPAGCAGEVLDQLTRMWDTLEQMQHRAATTLARLEASGVLLEQGGQRDADRWMRNSLGLAPQQAQDLARLGRAEVRGELPDTVQALTSGELSLGEAAAVVKGVENAVDKRSTQKHPDAGLFAAKMECGLLAAKDARPAMSVSQIGRAAQQIRARLDPHRIEADHEAAHAARGAQLSTTFGGTFLFQAWGSAADAPLLRAMLEGYTGPYSSDDGRSKSERLCDAFLAAARFAQSHQECTTPSTPVAIINITVPETTLAGADGEEAATTEDGQVLPVSLVRELLPESLIRRLVTEHKTGAVLDVGRTYRIAPPKIRAAAFHGHTTCAWQHGCDVPLRMTQADHIVEFSQGGATSAANIQPLCSTHNRLKHRWGLRRDRTMWSGRTRSRGHPVEDSDPPDPHPRE